MTFIGELHDLYAAMSVCPVIVYPYTAVTAGHSKLSTRWPLHHYAIVPLWPLHDFPCNPMTFIFVLCLLCPLCDLYSALANCFGHCPDSWYHCKPHLTNHHMRKWVWYILSSCKLHLTTVNANLSDTWCHFERRISHVYYSVNLRPC